MHFPDGLKKRRLGRLLLKRIAASDVLLQCLVSQKNITLLNSGYLLNDG